MTYQDRTFCTGGMPCCAKFAKCQKALTPEHQSQAKLAGLQVAQFISPTSMPCYIDPTAPKLEIAAKPKEKPALKRETKFFISSVPEKRWRQLFNAKPIQSASQIAAIVGCSDATVRTIRKRLGFPAYPSGGGYRKKYFRKDVEKIAKARKPGESVLALGARFGLGRGQIHHIATMNRDLFPMLSGNAGKPRR